jgi:hypothetical protein
MLTDKPLYDSVQFMNSPTALTERARHLLSLAALLALAAIIRFRFLASMDVSEFDPWRHLTLIDNLRAGVGFTLFDGQPYIWYNSLWYRLAALFGPSRDSAFLSAGLSMLSVVVLYWFLIRTEQSKVAAIAGAVLVAAYGPLVTFTGGYGSESLALLLMLLSCLLATYQPHWLIAVVPGLLFGIVLVSRINFIFAGLIVWPLLKDWKSRSLFGLGASSVLAIATWNTHAVLTAYPYVFTWDGMATRSADYSLMATLAPQLQPEIAAATREIYLRVASLPFDYGSRGGPVAIANGLFVLIATVCVLTTRRRWLIAATVTPMAYFLLLDSTLSTNFYRHYLAVFPSLFIGVAVVCARLARRANQRSTMAVLGWPAGLVLTLTLLGAPYLEPSAMPTLAMITPPPAALTEDRYMVNSGLFHPENLMQRYPGKAFIGMPYEPAAFEAFAKQYPSYTRILWRREFSIQDRVMAGLLESGRYRIVGQATSEAGLAYRILERQP